MHSTTSFFFKIVWTILGHLNFSMNFKTLLPISTRKPAGILVRIVLHLQISLGSTAVLMILSSSPWRWDAFYLDIFFQWFFSSSMYIIFHTLCTQLFHWTLLVDFPVHRKTVYCTVWMFDVFMEIQSLIYFKYSIIWMCRYTLFINFPTIKTDVGCFYYWSLHFNF